MGPSKGTEYLFLCLASGLPLLPLGLALKVLSSHIRQIVKPVGIVALILADDAATQHAGVDPVLAYVTEGRIPPSFGGYLEAARISAITGHAFRREPRYAGKQDRFPGATTVWTRPLGHTALPVLLSGRRWWHGHNYDQLA
jgi:hypothetical protein